MVMTPIASEAHERHGRDAFVQGRAHSPAPQRVISSTYRLNSFLARGFDVPRCRTCQARQAVQISRRPYVQEARTTGGTIETTEKWLLLA